MVPQHIRVLSVHSTILCREAISKNQAEDNSVLWTSPDQNFVEMKDSLHEANLRSGQNECEYFPHRSTYGKPLFTRCHWL